MLLRHCHAQDFSVALHLHGHRGICRTGDALNLRLEPVVLTHADHHSGVVNPYQDHAARRVGEGAYLPAEIGRHGPLELGSEPFS